MTDLISNDLKDLVVSFVQAYSAVTDLELVPPALVAVQVKVVPLVSEVTVVVPQPEDEVIDDS